MGVFIDGGEVDEPPPEGFYLTYKDKSIRWFGFTIWPRHQLHIYVYPFRADELEELASKVRAWSLDSGFYPTDFKQISLLEWQFRTQSQAMAVKLAFG